MDYSKWDKVVDSDEDEAKQPAVAQLRESLHREDRENRREMQEAIGEWLKRQMHLLRKEENNPSNRMSSMRHSSSLSEEKAPAPYRKVSAEERQVLAMLIAVSEFEEGETNLTRHPELLDLVRHHRWLEEDPGTLELLCRIHNAIMRRSGEGDSDDDREMRDRLLCGINTLAAPKRAKVAGGLLDLLTKICTPETEAARELRKKWQTKEFGKDALFDSLFPDLRQYDEEKADDSIWEIYLLFALIALIVMGVAGFIYFAGPLAASGRNHTRTFNSTTTTSTMTLMTTTVTTIAAAVGKVTGAGDLGIKSEL